MLRRCVASVITMCVVACVAAQELTLDSCLRLVEQNNAQLRVSRLKVEEAKQVKQQAFTKYFPSVSAMSVGFASIHPMLEYGIGDVKNEQLKDVLNTLYFEYGAPMGIARSFSLFHRGVYAGLTAMQPVYMGGQIVQGNKLASLGVEAAQLQTELVRKEVLLQAEELYWVVVSLHEKRKTVTKAEELLASVKQTVEAAYDAGVAQRSDMLKVTIKENELASNRLKLQSGVDVATKALCQVMGIAYSDSLVLLDTIAAPGATALSEPLAMEVNVDERIEKRLLDLNVESFALRRKMEIGASLPKLVIGASYGYNNVMEKNATNGTIFATLQIPITSWWETSHRVREVQLQHDEAVIERSDLVNKMEIQTYQMRQTLQELQAQVLIAQSNVDLAQESVSEAMLNYKAGLCTLAELLETQTLYMQAVDTWHEQVVQFKINLRKYNALAQ